MMKKPKTKQVKSKQIDEWIFSGKAILRNNLRPEDMEGWSDYHLFDDNGLLIRNTFERKDGILYEKYSEYLNFDKKIEERKRRVDQQIIFPNASFSGYIMVTVKDFETMIRESDKMLAKEFSMSTDVLDHSMESLNHLDKVIKKMLKKFDAGDFEEKYAVLISAY